ncbi:MAG: hypothetical protein PHQ23_16840 [Candidatus Wallbacteria bacterium]|nr:hypothetical protein [Candidatus Wallbacteria bacterium]
MLQKQTKRAQPEFVVNESGEKIKVILDYGAYLELMALVEDLGDAKMISETRSEGTISLDEYKRKRKIA